MSERPRPILERTGQPVRRAKPQSAPVPDAPLGEGPRPLRRWPFVAGSAALLLVLLIALAWSAGWLRRFTRAYTVEPRIPTSMANRDLRGAEINRDRLVNRINQTFLSADEALVAGRWMALGSARFYEDETNRVRASEQAALLLYAAESEDRALFDQVWGVIEGRLLREDGSLQREAEGGSVAAREREAGLAQRLSGEAVPSELLEEAQVAGLVAAPPEGGAQLDARRDWGAQLMTLRALLIAYQGRGAGWQRDAIARLSEAWLDARDGDWPPYYDRDLGVPPAPTPYIAPAEGPDREGAIHDEDDLPLPSASATQPEGEATTLRVVRLADLDLEALRMLEAVDARFAPSRAHAQRLLEGAAAELRPFVKQAYDVAGASYLTWYEDEAYVMEDQMAIWLALASQDGLPPETAAFLASQARDGQLYERYGLVDGAGLDGRDQPRRYGQLLRILRWSERQEDWRALLSRMQAGMIGTVTTSPSYGLVFRAMPQSANVYLALADNIWLLLGSG